MELLGVVVIFEWKKGKFWSKFKSIESNLKTLKKKIIKKCIYLKMSKVKHVVKWSMNYMLKNLLKWLSCQNEIQLVGCNPMIPLPLSR